MPSIVIVPGDGFGPSVMEVAERTLDAVSGGIDIATARIGISSYDACGQDVSVDTLDLLEGCSGVLCGPLVVRRDASGKVHDAMDTLRSHMDLYATLRNFRTFGDLGPEGVNVYLWSGITRQGRDTVEVRGVDGFTLSKYIRSSFYRRTIDLAFSQMKVQDSTRIACISKDDIFPDSSALFRQSFDEVFGKGGFETTHMNVTEWAESTIRQPQRFDSIVCADLYSDVAAGILAGITGGNRLSPHCFMGDRGNLMVPSMIGDYEGIPDGYANPTSAIMSVAMMLLFSGRLPGAKSVIEALGRTYGEGCRTPDVGGDMTTAEFAERFYRNL